MKAALVTPFLSHLPLHPSSYLGYGSAILRKRFELEIIDVGAEEIETSDDHIYVTTSLEDFGAMQKKFEEMKIEPENAELKRIANNTKELSVEESKKVLRMVEDFEELDDVQNVFHNLEMTEELEHALNKE